MPVTSFLRSTGFSLLLASAAACGDSPTAPSGNQGGGQDAFQFTVSGDLSASESDDGACAYYMTAGEVLSIGLYSVNSLRPTTWELDISPPSGEFVSAGSHTFGTGAWSAQLWRLQATSGGTYQSDAYWEADSGTLTISSVAGDRVEGSFSFSASAVPPTGPFPSISVSGSFNAGPWLATSSVSCG